MRYAILPVLACAVLAADDTGWRKVEQTGLSEAQVQEIITGFAAKEAQFAKARENYTYRQSVKVQSVDPDGKPTGQHELVSDIVYPEGKRTEHVVRAPVDTLTAFTLSPEDYQDLQNVQPFVLTTSEIPKYYVRYLGKQMVDEIPAYVFAVRPRKLEKGLRYFQGQIWVDDRDLQIVKTYGRGVGVTGKEENLFPKFETYREQIDGKYWFPTYTHADDVLAFKEGPQGIRMLVTYKNYKQFRSEVNIQYGDAVGSDQPKKPEPKKPEPAKP